MNNLGYDLFNIDNNGERYEIQKCDEAGVFATDRDATIAALNDAIGGNMQAAEICKDHMLNEPLKDNTQ